MKIIQTIKRIFFTKKFAALLLAAIVGAAGWQLFNDGLEYTSQEEFCVSCHSMQQPQQELKQTVHWSNAKGVTATCADCHLPHDKLNKYIRKVQALKEVYAEMTGKFAGEGEFDKHRLEMAEREWARMSANGSKECKTCHNYQRMDFTKMSASARNAMKPAAERDQSCIDCHKGIAHHLPKATKNTDMGTPSKFEHLVVNSLTPAKNYYTKSKVELFADEAMTQNIGNLETAVPVTFVKAGEKADLIELKMWRKAKGFGRIWYNDFGKNITDAILSKAFMSSTPQFEVIESKDDPITGLTWQNVKMQAWIAKSNLIENISAVWEDAENSYKTQCSTCHRQPEVTHFDSNTWIGLFKGMVGFTNMNKETANEVLRYLQMHSSDFNSHAENMPSENK
ncbi:pentaheme c-type cytochrome TorC [Actinobacillus seminis]|uniref:pentaheme c-type cytochrome TorC n=1 Tax=Actinobacillus seminis TaxID=722 RepID=UPI003B923E0C